MRALVIFASLGLIAFVPAANAGVTYVYDTLGRLSTATYDNGEQIAYTYDPAGNRTQVVTQPAPPRGAIVKHSAKAKKKRKH